MVKLEAYESLKERNPKRILNGEVYKGAKKTMTEYDVLLAQLRGMQTIKLSERKITIPGFSRNLSFLLKVVADFKKAEEELYRPPEYAGTDQITTQFLRPQHFNYSEWKRDVTLPSGDNTTTAEIIPNASGKFSVSGNPPSTAQNMRFVITDLIEYVSDSPVRDIKIEDEDGETRYTNTSVKEFNASELHIFTFDYPVYVTTTLDLDALVYSHTTGADVTHELTPIGLWVGYGEDVPPLEL